MNILALLLAAGTLTPAFEAPLSSRPAPLLWETPVSWTAPEAPARGPDLGPEIADKVRKAREVYKTSGAAKAAEFLAKEKDLELVLLRAGLKHKAGELAGAMKDYEIILDSKDRTASRALAISGFKAVLHQRIEAGEKELYARLIRILKEEWRNEEALSILPLILKVPGLTAATKNYLKSQEPIMALRLGRYEEAAKIWAKPADRSQTEWLARTEQRRGNFKRAAELRLSLAEKAAKKAKDKQLEAAWDFLVRGGLWAEAKKLAEKHADLKKAPDYAWRMGLAAFYAKDYKAALEFFETLAGDPKAKRRQGAGYFLARVLEASGQPGQAKKAYHQAAGGPFGYYQILARGRLNPLQGEFLGGTFTKLLNPGPSGRDCESLGYFLWLSEKGLTLTEMERAATRLASLKAVLAGKKREDLNKELQGYLSRHDWRGLSLFVKRNPDAARAPLPEAKDLWLKLAASASARTGDYRQAVSFFSRIPSPDPKGLKRWSHPLVYSREVTGAYRLHGLSPALTLALIRTESAFQPDIMSASNARGLMQLLPATANKIAAIFGEPEPGALDLFDPGLNIRYGTWYLKALADGFGSEALALAGYNGGPYNIKSLILAKPDMPLDIFIETLPFEETANYVKRITESRHIYEKVYLGREHLPDYTAPVKPPAPSLPDF